MHGAPCASAGKMHSRGEEAAMCGLIGVLHVDGARVDAHALQSMTDAQRHRGPDDRGAVVFSLRRRAWADAPVGCPVVGDFEGGLGFTRLSIIDLSPHGHQPMISNGGGVLLAFNGEIYNAVEYRHELEAYGCTFRGHSDTEVILYLYERYGLEGTLARLNGMFALAIVDLRAQRVFLARDRFGIKPLYWYRRGNVVLFASEVKAFRHHPHFEARVDANHVAEYLAFRYCAGDRFLLENVKQVEPGSWVELSESTIQVRRYWSLPASRPESGQRFASAVSELSARLSESVRMQLMSDVPVGCQLSGGIDSSLVTAFAKQHRSESTQLQAFSIVVDDEHLSEERWIDEAARRVNVICNKFRMREGDFLNRIERATWHLDQPLNHPNSVGIYYLAERSRRDVTVLLSGEGADELLGGYARYFRSMFHPVLNALEPVARLLPGRPRLSSFVQDRVGWSICASSYSPDQVLRRVSVYADLAKAVEVRRAMFPADGSFLRRSLNYELATHLVDLLVRQDKMTMAHSLENRVPFLDHTLVEYVATLPDAFLVGRRFASRNVEMRNVKRVLKKLAERFFASEFVYREKCGFGVPLARFMAGAAMRSLIGDVVLPRARDHGLFDANAVRQLLVQPSIPGHAEVVWSCVALGLWVHQFVNGNPPA